MELRKTTFRAAIIFLLVIAATVGASAQYYTVKEIADKTNDSLLRLTTAQLSGKAPAYVGGGFQLINDRRIESPLNAIAARCLYYKFKEYGLNAQFTDTTLNPANGKLETIYSVKPGKDPKKIIILAAAFDSNAPSKDSISPGANASASSCAVVIEAARIMQNYTTERTMVFALFDDMNNTGSGVFKLLDSLRKQGYESTTAIFLDNLGYKGETGYITLHFTDTTKNASIKKAFLDVKEILYPDEEAPAMRRYFTPFGGMQKSFANAEEALFGRNFEMTQPYVNTKDDDISHLELPFYFRNARTAIAAFALLANPFTASAADAPSPAILRATNPCRGTLRITSERALGSLKIFDLYGKEVYSGFEANSDALINATGFAPGVYFIQSEGGAAKFVKM